jgi:acetylornithine deacetylase/succinyl-diaminopimelate desuccinylase-like protein
VDAIARLEPALAAVLRTTCVPTVFNAGTRPNVIPATAEATVNCRLLPDETSRRSTPGSRGGGRRDIQVELNMKQPTRPPRRG